MNPARILQAFTPSRARSTRRRENARATIRFLYRKEKGYTKLNTEIYHVKDLPKQKRRFWQIAYDFFIIEFEKISPKKQS